MPQAKQNSILIPVITMIIGTILFLLPKFILIGNSSLARAVVVILILSAQLWFFRRAYYASGGFVYSAIPHFIAMAIFGVMSVVLLGYSSDLWSPDKVWSSVSIVWVFSESLFFGVRMIAYLAILGLQFIIIKNWRNA